MNPELENLLEKANNLPLSPGVYIMRGKDGKVIYVGKSKALKNRVSQYFQNTSSHNTKTFRMVDNVRSFDYILTDTEMEALTLENSLIKLHAPKYNIRLKDDKNYPYIRINPHDPYPNLSMVRKRTGDNARYFGPYSSAQAVYSIIRTLGKSFGLYSCKHRFPEDIGKVRPCIYSQIGQCSEPCTGKETKEAYSERIHTVLEVLNGRFSELKATLTEKMNTASERLEFESAAVYRDRIKSLETLRQKQKVVAGPDVEQDVFAFYSDMQCSCIAIFTVRNGCLVDRDTQVFGADTILTEESVSSFLLSYYQFHDDIPREILIGKEMPEEDREVLEELLRESAGVKISIRTPKRGDGRALCQMAYENAEHSAKLFCTQTEKDNETLAKLASLLSLEVVPERIEAFDISNLGNEAITAGMVVFSDGKPKKSQYRTFRITDTAVQDDYASMHEAIGRRLKHLSETEDENRFSESRPDLILVDGGVGQVTAAKTAMKDYPFEIPVFGMVKDEYHKTRTLTDGAHEIDISREQAVFSLIYNIQEEVHRYSVASMSRAKRKTIKKSSLTEIPTIGDKKAKELLKAFGSRKAIAQASVEQIANLPGFSGRNAEEVYTYFHNQNGKESNGTEL